MNSKVSGTPVNEQIIGRNNIGSTASVSATFYKTNVNINDEKYYLWRINYAFSTSKYITSVT